jgi:hypothetical protein
MIVCPACGRPTEPGWANCLNCGKALIQSRVKPGETLPPREMPQSQPPVQQQPQYQQPAPQQQYHQQPQQQYQQQYQPRRKSCFGRFIGWLLLAVFLWYLFTHLIPAFADLHTLFDGEYTTPHQVGQWFARLIP